MVLSTPELQPHEPFPVPIRATRPYRGPADAGPKGVSWGSAIRTRTNSFFRLSGCLLPHSPLGPRATCARQDLNLRCPRPQRGLDAAGVRARSRHPVPTRTAGLTGAGSQPCVTACRRGTPTPATACGRRDSNAQAARSELARYPGSRHSRIVRHQGLEPRTVSLRGCCSDHLS